MSKELVVVTGGTGFVGTHCIMQLLKAGYRVRTTVRSLKREPELRKVLKANGIEAGDNLWFAEADLTADKGWKEALAGCDYVLHVASPFPSAAPKTEDELYIPAREGTLRILKAARDAGVKRTVITSSFAAIGYGQPITDKPYTEENWTDINGGNMSTYVKSKTLAEHAAWDFMKREGGNMELSVVNPVGIFGPVLRPEVTTSTEIIQRIMNGDLPGIPRLSFGIVDVRDVADLHLRAMTNPAAKGERFLAVAGNFIPMPEIAIMLKAKMGNAAKRVPTRILPDWLLKVAALFDSSLKQAIPELGKSKQASNEKAKRLLGWQPRSNEEAIIATAESLVKFGLVKS